MNMSLALTPTLTHSTSPTASDCTDRRGSMTSSYNSQWSVPSELTAGGTYNQTEGMMPSTKQGQMLWPGVVYDANGASPNSTVIISEDEETPPTTAVEGKSPQRRRSSAGMWANAFNQMKLDDPSQQGLMLDANGQLQFPFAPQRNGTFPQDRPGMQSRQPTNDTNFWKIFLDPSALATPDQRFDMDPTAMQDTPRGLSKSNSMPDLTTPPSATANAAPFPQALGQVDTSSGATDGAAMDRWKDHIQQRQASFSIHLSPDKNGKIRTQALANASFASSHGGRPVRPLPSALIPAAGSLNQTLAPERLPSFGTPPTDPTTPMPGHPGYGQLGYHTMTPKSRLSKQYFERPINKRQASQTLVPDAQKRTSIA